MWVVAAYWQTHIRSQLAWFESQWPPGTESVFIKWTELYYYYYLC